MRDWFWILADWIDDKIIGHRFYWLCDFICKHYPDNEVEIEVDEEIRDLVNALNAYKIPTVSSCSGHGQEYGHIWLKDGRILVIIPQKRTKHEIVQILRINR